MCPIQRLCVSEDLGKERGVCRRLEMSFGRQAVYDDTQALTYNTTHLRFQAHENALPLDSSRRCSISRTHRVILSSCGAFGEPCDTEATLP